MPDHSPTPASSAALDPLEADVASLRALLALPARQRRFPDALEREFRRHMLEEGLRLTQESRRVLLVTAPVMFLLLRLLLSALSSPEHAEGNLAVLDAILLAECAVVVAIAITPWLPAVRRLYPVYAMLTSGSAVAIVVVGASAFPEPYVRQFAALVIPVVVLLVYALGVVSVRLSTMAACSGVLAGFVVIVAQGLWLDPAYFLAYSVLSNLVGVLVALLIDVRDRTGFLSARLLDAEKRRVDRYAAEVERLSRQDVLTGLANRRRFDEALAREFALAQRQRTPIAVVFVDVDHFKAYNDSCGHPAGDRALADVGRAIGGVVRRPPDLAARYGGEEFVVLLPGTPLAGATDIARDIQHAVAGLQLPHPASSVGPFVTASLGVAARVPAPDERPETLLTAADAALYRAKAGGRHRVEVASPVA